MGRSIDGRRYAETQQGENSASRRDFILKFPKNEILSPHKLFERIQFYYNFQFDP